MGMNKFIKYGIYLVTIGICYIPLFILSIIAREVILVIILAIPFGILLFTGLALGVGGYISNKMQELLAKQPCPVCGENKLRFTGFIKIFCDGCDKKENA